MLGTKAYSFPAPCAKGAGTALSWQAKERLNLQVCWGRGILPEAPRPASSWLSTKEPWKLEVGGPALGMTGLNRSWWPETSLPGKATLGPQGGVVGTLASSSLLPH